MHRGAVQRAISLIEISANLDHLLLGLLSAYKLRKLPVDVDTTREGHLAITFVLSATQLVLYHRRIRAFGRELSKYLIDLYTIDVRTQKAHSWQTIL